MNVAEFIVPSFCALASQFRLLEIMGAHVLGVAFIGLVLYFVGHLVWPRGVRLPPGPPGWPLIGNMFDMPIHAPYKTFGAMSEKYGKCIDALHKVHRSFILH
jgi:hypothetical protein